MSRLTLRGIVSSLILCTPALARADEAEDKAVAVVAKFGYVVRYDPLPAKPVIGVVVIGNVTDAELKELAAFKYLTHLDLNACTGLTDASVKELANLKTLTKLDLQGTQVTEAGVKELQKALPDCKIKK